MFNRNKRKKITFSETIVVIIICIALLNALLGWYLSVLKDAQIYSYVSDFIKDALVITIAGQFFSKTIENIVSKNIDSVLNTVEKINKKRK